MKRPRLEKPWWAVALAVSVAAALALAACGSSSTTASGSPSTSQSFVVASPSASATPLPTPTVAGTIAFTRAVEPDARYAIYVVHSDGTGLKRLTDDAGQASYPSWSPDGSRIAYQAGPNVHGSGWSVWVMNADGSAKTRVTKGAVRGAWPSWSPDGKQIVLVKLGLQSGIDVAVMNADGSGLKRVTHAGAPADQLLPTWAPDGKILFLQRGDVLAVNSDGSGLMRLTKDGDIVGYALSPDGKQLAIHRTTIDCLQVGSVRGGGTPVTLLEPVSDYISLDPYVTAAWTSDGGALALASNDYYGLGGSPLYIVNADGSGLSAVPGVDDAIAPSWRPK